MPQGTNSTMCVGQAKHYQLCQQQVRTTSSTDWFLLGDVGCRGPHLELQEHQQSGCDWSVRGMGHSWGSVPLKTGEMGSTLWD